jgi:hypothetical protein
LKVAEEETLHGGMEGMIAPIDRGPAIDEQGRGREIQVDAADEGAKVVPGHLGNMSLTGQRGWSVISAEAVGHIDGGSSLTIVSGIYSNNNVGSCP